MKRHAKRRRCPAPSAVAAASVGDGGTGEERGAGGGRYCHDPEPDQREDSPWEDIPGGAGTTQHGAVAPMNPKGPRYHCQRCCRGAAAFHLGNCLAIPSVEGEVGRRPCS